MSVLPFFFGSPDRRLFGCRHAPLTAPTKACGVVLSPPMGQEYIRSHRAYRQLAVLLSEAGCHVLRFDYGGCGDSQHGPEAWRVRAWVDDLMAAIDEAKARCGVAHVCVVGLRLGATLAMMAAAEREDIDSVALWEPVVDGAAYVESLEAWHRQTLWYPPAWHEDPHTGTRWREIVGFPLAEALIDDLRRINLCELDLRAKRCLLVQDEADEGTALLCRRLRGAGAAVEVGQHPGPKVWQQEAERSLVPLRTLQSLVAWIAGEAE